MATSVQTSTSSSAAIRPAAVGAAVCALHWLITLTFAPNMESTLISDHKSLSVVSFHSLDFFLHINLCLCDFSSYWYEIQVYTAPKCRHCKGIAEDCNLPQKNKFVLFSVCDIQEWCVLVEWCTTHVCRLVAGPVGHCPAMRHVPLMIVPRDAAVQTALFMMMCASAVCSCKP